MKLAQISPDDIIEQVCKNVAGRSTRRSILGRAARLALGLLGIEIVPAALSKETWARTEAAMQAVDCSYWKYCGAYGWLCAGCGGADNSCPEGCTSYNQVWFGCCEDPNGVNKLIAYVDCCTALPQNVPTCDPDFECLTPSRPCDHVQVWCPLVPFPEIQYYCCSQANEAFPSECTP